MVNSAGSSRNRLFSVSVDPQVGHGPAKFVFLLICTGVCWYENMILKHFCVAKFWKLVGCAGGAIFIVSAVKRKKLVYLCVSVSVSTVCV